LNDHLWLESSRVIRQRKTSGRERRSKRELKDYIIRRVVIEQTHGTYGVAVSIIVAAIYTSNASLSQRRGIRASLRHGKRLASAHQGNERSDNLQMSHSSFSLGATNLSLCY